MATMNKDVTIFLDIDGVLADCHHRLHYADAKDWDKFYGPEMAEDKPMRMIVQTITDMFIGLQSSYRNVKVVLITGRREGTRPLTDLWLRCYAATIWSYSEDREYFRPDDDHRKSDKLKADFVREYIDWCEPEVRANDDFFIIDDDPTNIMAMQKVLKNDYGVTEDRIFPLCVGTDLYGKLNGSLPSTSP